MTNRKTRPGNPRDHSPMHHATNSITKIGDDIKTKKQSLRDRGRRRHVSLAMDFDSRATILTLEIGENWENVNKELWRENQRKIREDLKAEFGEVEIDTKIDNFIALDSKPLSIISYHNRFFHQVREAYVIGAYYPALIGACALGERILNHLIIDLRDFYTSTPEYKNVYRKKSFDKWEVPIKTLLSWDVLLPNVAEEFRLLQSLRNRSIHFNVETYSTIKDDALSAILHLRAIIDQQFSSHGTQPWFLKGTKGHQFIAREWEGHPFIQTYFFHCCPFVGPYFSIERSKKGVQAIDHTDYGEGEWSDEEFASTFNERTPDMVASNPITGK